MITAILLWLLCFFGVVWLLTLIARGVFFAMRFMPIIVILAIIFLLLS